MLLERELLVGGSQTESEESSFLMIRHGVWWQVLLETLKHQFASAKLAANETNSGYKIVKL